MLELNREEKFTVLSPFDELVMVGSHWPIVDEDPRAVLLIVHGSGEHYRRYKHMAEFFNRQQIACVAFDRRGHGESEGARGYVPCIDALHDDLEEMIKLIRTKWYAEVPIVIYSHGTGSLVCLSHLVRRKQKPLDCQAMIISTPSLCLQKRPSCLIFFFSRAFANLDPHTRLPVEGNYTNVYTNDPSVVEIYRNDPLVHDRWPAKTISILMELGLLLEKSVVRTRCPILIQHGAADTVTPISGIRKWVRTHVKGDVRFVEWSNNLHELHNDLNKDAIFDYLTHWIEEKLKI